ncbi:MAG: hypothetical protein MPEBLZ_00525, partial [Candidatus Methanoperedens nitroreducens]
DGVRLEEPRQRRIIPARAIEVQATVEAAHRAGRTHACFQALSGIAVLHLCGNRRRASAPLIAHVAKRLVQVFGDGRAVAILSSRLRPLTLRLAFSVFKVRNIGLEAGIQPVIVCCHCAMIKKSTHAHTYVITTIINMARLLLSRFKDARLSGDILRRSAAGFILSPDGSKCGLL